jgi:hypothetical protein
MDISRIWRVETGENVLEIEREFQSENRLPM